MKYQTIVSRWLLLLNFLVSKFSAGRNKLPARYIQEIYLMISFNPLTRCAFFKRDIIRQLQRLPKIILKKIPLRSSLQFISWSVPISVCFWRELFFSLARVFFLLRNSNIALLLPPSLGEQTIACAIHLFGLAHHTLFLCGVSTVSLLENSLQGSSSWLPCREHEGSFGSSNHSI